MEAWKPPDIGTMGRHAQVWVLNNGVAVSATDADVAGHALAIVIVALSKKGRSITRLKLWADELLKSLPKFPDDTFTELEETQGDVETNVNLAVAAYGYVKPAAAGHECGGALFDQKTHLVTPFQPQTVWIAGRLQ